MLKTRAVRFSMTRLDVWLIYARAIYKSQMTKVITAVVTTSWRLKLPRDIVAGQDTAWKSLSLWPRACRHTAGRSSFDLRPGSRPSAAPKHVCVPIRGAWHTTMLCHVCAMDLCSPSSRARLSLITCNVV
jgi:hypothetical protein